MYSFMTTYDGFCTCSCATTCGCNQPLVPLITHDHIRNASLTGHQVLNVAEKEYQEGSMKDHDWRLLFKTIHDANKPRPVGSRSHSLHGSGALPDHSDNGRPSDEGDAGLPHTSKRKRSAFSEEMDDAILAGYEKFSNRAQTWACILRERSDLFGSLSGQQIKDRHRVLKKQMTGQS
jgi:hypothetical protein